MWNTCSGPAVFVAVFTSSELSQWWILHHVAVNFVKFCSFAYIPPDKHIYISVLYVYLSMLEIIHSVKTYIAVAYTE